ncbi:hypothetical protein JYG23_05700 [Sedimentibacter sp. zth1]|uniref:hypothetical protein n=1 Tax=Sedimentibacter sp. zth1 TaxID=2816908 RepID=UPI001A936F6E|nr:hypothetical protein [Sedimentibacter sp. zth1]QSX06923.1 hypothetical protein JYG23_05700 [Sedimentibacter sp. zth1]
MVKVQKNELTITQIKYMLILSELSNESTKIQCKDVAKLLGVTKPSVHTMINGLCELDLIYKPHYGKVSITEKGKEIITECNACFYPVEIYYNKIFGFDIYDARKVAVTLFFELGYLKFSAMSDKMMALLDMKY